MANDGIYPPRPDIQSKLQNAGRAWANEAEEWANKWVELREELRQTQNAKGQTQNASLEHTINKLRRDMVEADAAAKRFGKMAASAGAGTFLSIEALQRDPRFTQKWQSLRVECEKLGLVKRDMDDVAAQATRTATPSAKTLGER